jgi:hypothetical protein
MKKDVALRYATTYYLCVATRAEHAARPGRESLSKRLGKVARQIKARDEGRCQYCGGTETSTGRHMHLDHLLPKDFGGADVATNLIVCCSRCNSARQNMTLKQWQNYASVTYGVLFEPRTIRAQARRRLPELS